MEHLGIHGRDYQTHFNMLGIQCYCDESLEGLDSSDCAPDFFGYANGKYDWMKNGQLTKQTVPSLMESANGNICKTRTEFIQRWLYFELLREFFAGFERFSTESFIRRGSLGEDPYVDTKNLNTLLSKWKSWIQLSRPALLLIRIADVLQRAQHYTSKYLAENMEWDDVQEEAVLGIMLLGETLSKALCSTIDQLYLDGPDWHNLTITDRGWGYSKYLVRSMQTEGSKFSKVSIDHLRKRLNDYSTGLLHVQIYLKSFSADDFGTADREYKHFHLFNCDSHGACGLTTVQDYQKVINIINNDSLPLFRYHKPSGSLNVEAHKFSEVQNYIVLSHVWADGFGDLGGNRLTKCVLDMLMGLFPYRTKLEPEIRRDQAPPRDQTLLFWIDTLGIPNYTHKPAHDEDKKMYDEARIKAIEAMHKIYTNAYATFVLDGSVVKQVKGKDWLDAAMRISLGNWIRRLWTLQEAILSSKLYFVFKDIAISIEGFEAERQNRIDSQRQNQHWPQYECIEHIAHWYRSSILWDNRKSFRGASKTDMIGKVWHAAQWRTTDHRRHEALSFATLFDLPVRDFADSVDKMDDTEENKNLEADLDKRMAKLLKLLDRENFKIPPGMLFLVEPRLYQKGLRWAPRTWMATRFRTIACDYPLSGGSSKFIAEHGLQVRLPAIILSNLELKQNLAKLAKQKKSFHFPTHRRLHEWYRVDKIGDPTSVWLNTSGENIKELALVLFIRPDSEKREIALLVAVPVEGCVSIILNRVYISKVNDSKVLQEQKTEFRDPAKTNLCYGKHVESIDWIIDGPEPMTKPIGSEENKEEKEKKEEEEKKNKEAEKEDPQNFKFLTRVRRVVTDRFGSEKRARTESPHGLWATFSGETSKVFKEGIKKKHSETKSPTKFI